MQESAESKAIIAAAEIQAAATLAAAVYAKLQDRGADSAIELFRYVHQAIQPRTHDVF